MKKIKIKILGHVPNNTFIYSYFILTILKKYYDVELSDKPDYLFYNDSAYDHYKYPDCIKIYYTGENISPNFNSCDYAISHDYIHFEDRHYRLPIYLVYTFYSQEELDLAGKNYLAERPILTKNDILLKKEFCSFIYSNYRAEKERKLIFELLGTYKKVNAAGSYLNNTGGTKIKNKLAYETNHKFSIAFENSSRSGYTTEKLISGLVANTIPIYWGNPHIANEFNTKRFINCHDYSSFEEVLARVKLLDTNDELYLKMINEPIFANTYDAVATQNGIDYFLRNILDQPKEKARRRTINPVKALEILRQEKIIAEDVKKRTFTLRILARAYKPFKGIKGLERAKHLFFKRT